MSLEFYKQDSAHDLRAASLAWDALLLNTKIELELATCSENLTVAEQSKQGGLKFVGAKRYAKKNNKRMGGNYDSAKERSYITYAYATYVDASNLYGWAMVHAFSYKDIKFENCPPDVGGRLRTLDDAATVYFGEVDLEFPPELHDHLTNISPRPETPKTRG